MTRVYGWAFLDKAGREAGALLRVTREDEGPISRYAKKSAHLLNNPACLECIAQINCGHTEPSARDLSLVNQMRESCAISPHETSLSIWIFLELPAIFCFGFTPFAHIIPLHLGFRAFKTGRFHSSVILLIP